MRPCHDKAKTDLMKIIGTCLSVALAVILCPAQAQAQNLFVSDYNSGNVYEFTPGGTRSIFASGLSRPLGLAFDSAGNLYVAEQASGNVYKFAPDGTRSTLASGVESPYGLAVDHADNLFVEVWGYPGFISEYTPGGIQSTFASKVYPWGLAFDGLGNLFETDFGSGNIYEFTPGGTRTTFASGLASPTFLAFQPVPEPATYSLLELAAVFLLGIRRLRRP